MSASRFGSISAASLKRGRMTSLRGLLLTHLSRVWNHASFSEGMASSGLPEPGISTGKLACFAVVTQTHRFSPQRACFG